MRVSKLDWSPYFINSMRDKINKKPQYQRTEVWPVRKKVRLIDSILRGFDIPKFYVASSEEPYDYEVVDGQQRMTAILDFMDGKLEITGNFEKWGKLSGKKFQGLSSEMNRYFGNFQLHFVLLDEVEEGEIEELFIRLQEGVPASQAEKRNARLGNMRDFVADIAETNSFFKYSRIPPARFKWHDYTAHVLRLELSEGPTDLSGKALTDMYRNEDEFPMNGKVAKKVKRVFNYLLKGIRAKTGRKPLPELSKKWPFVDLYWLTSCFLDEYNIIGLHLSIIEFYIEFENMRSKAKRAGDESLARGDFWQRQLFKYLQAFRSEGNKRDKVEHRHAVCRLYALRYFSGKGIDLVPRDNRRRFTDEERIIVWRRDGQTCQICGKDELDFEEIEADHVKSHSKGGQTILSNAQCLCLECNRKKGNKV